MSSSGGISSLGGFAYQIKVFVYYLEKLQENMEIGYETYEDVALELKPDDSEYIDKNCSGFNSIYNTLDGIIAIQVKKAKLDEKDYCQLIYNWLLLEMSKDKVSKYILFMDSNYNNADLIFSNSPEIMYRDILSCEEKKSLKFKVKKLIEDDFEKFAAAYKKIKENYEIILIESIDNEIDKAFNKTFRKSKVGSKIFNMRLEALMGKITVDIMKNVVNNKPFICTYDQFMSLIEDITQSINEKEICTDFSIFKLMNPINLKDTEVAKSRQYKQLCACYKLDSKIEEHLVYEEYYNDFKLRSLENMRDNIINNIEGTTYSHYTDAKDYLYEINKDTPFMRLDETKKRRNSHTQNEQIYYGSAIHLTKNNVEKNLLISWKDEEDE